MIKFIDLFAGIGGIRTAFERAGAQCVFSSEWDKFAQKTYEANFAEKPYGDIREIPSEQIPDHDILLAGFPCQPFSISGVSKKNSLGHKHGFEDKKQGNLFFEIERILRDKQPTAFLLENVKHLKRHDKGNTFRVMCETLEEKLNYRLFTNIVDGQYYTPQHRERILIVGLRCDLYSDFEFIFPDVPQKRQVNFPDILEPEVEEKYTLSDHLWTYLQNYKKKHSKRGNGFGYGLVEVEPETVTRTLSARYYKDGSEILIAQEGKNPRRLTPRECARLMGFADDFEIPVSDTQAYKQFGNSVVIPAVEAVAKRLIQIMPDTTKASESNGEIEIVSQKTVLHSIPWEQITFLQDELLKWGQSNYENFPWRTTDNHWHALTAEIMLQRTNAKQVVPAFQDFTQKYETPSDLVADENAQVFATLGLHWREKYLRKLAETISDTEIPCNKKELKKLPSVGDYIASAYRSMHLGLYDRIIDSNAVRLYGRFYGFPTDGETRRKKWFIQLAETITPSEQTKQFNYALLDFTRDLCKSSPICSQCPLKTKCHYYAHDSGF